MQDEIRSVLDVDEAQLDDAWRELQRELSARFESSVGLEGILFLIGIQESGHGFQPRLKKERKQDLIMQGTYHVLEGIGLYSRTGPAESGGHWERRVELPELSIEQQEKLLRVAIIRYFGREPSIHLQ